MSYLVSDVFIRVQRQIGDTAGAQIIDADVLRWINDAQRDISQQNDVLQKIGSANTVSSQSAYALPTDCQRLVRVAYQGGALQNVSMEQINELIPQHDQTNAQGFPAGTPIYYWVYAGMINLWPSPVQGNAGDLTIYYTRKPTDVTSDSSSIDLPDEYFNSVVQYCIVQAYELDTNYYASMLKQQGYEQSVAGLKGQRNWEDQNSYPSITAISEYDYPGLGQF